MAHPTYNSSRTLWPQPPPRLTPPTTVQGHCGHHHPYSSPHLQQVKDTVATTTPTAHPTYNRSRTLWPPPPLQRTPPTTVQGHCGHNHPHGSPHLQQFKDTVATTTPMAHPTYNSSRTQWPQPPPRLTQHTTVQGHCGHHHPHGSPHLQQFKDTVATTTPTAHPTYNSARTLWPQPPPQLNPPTTVQGHCGHPHPHGSPHVQQFKDTVATTIPMAHPTYNSSRTLWPPPPPQLNPPTTVQGHCGHPHPHGSPHVQQFKDTVATTTPMAHPTYNSSRTQWPPPPPWLTPPTTVQGHCGHHHPHGSPHLQQFKDTVATTTPMAHPTYNSSRTQWPPPPPWLTPPTTVLGHCGHHHPHGSPHLQQFKDTVATTTPMAHPTYNSSRTLWPPPPPWLTPPTTVQGHCGHHHPHGSPHLQQFKDTVATTTPMAHPTYNSSRTQWPPPPPWLTPRTTVQGHSGHHHPHGSPHLQQFKDTVATTTPMAHPTYNSSRTLWPPPPPWLTPPTTVQGHSGHHHPHGSPHLQQF